MPRCSPTLLWPAAGQVVFTQLDCPAQRGRSIGRSGCFTRQPHRPTLRSTRGTRSLPKVLALFAAIPKGLRKGRHSKGFAVDANSERAESVFRCPEKQYSRTALLEWSNAGCEAIIYARMLVVRIRAGTMQMATPPLSSCPPAPHGYTRLNVRCDSPSGSCRGW
jgi:hypothetical protein